MTKVRYHARRWALGAGVACALGFGAAQALATPSTSAPPDTCDRRACKDYCAARGASGTCSGGMCICFIPVE
ncbi:MAG TPA: hypothetical protein VF746_03740 [Longimicrobium sp.]|jgi:hypothetical protein